MTIRLFLSSFPALKTFRASKSRLVGHSVCFRATVTVVKRPRDGLNPCVCVTSNNNTIFFSNRVINSVIGGIIRFDSVSLSVTTCCGALTATKGAKKLGLLISLSSAPHSDFWCQFAVWIFLVHLPYSQDSEKLKKASSSGNEVRSTKMEPERNQFKRRTTHCPLRPLIVTLYIICLATQSQAQTVNTNSQNITKNIENLDIETPCHRCQTSNVSFVEEVIDAVGTFTKDYILVNKTEKQLENEIEGLVDGILSKDKYEIFDGVEIKKTNNTTSRDDDTRRRDDDTKRSDDDTKRSNDSEGRALFPKYSYEYRLYQKVKNFIDTHVLSINLSKAARFVSFRSFGLKKFFVPLLIGAQVFKSILLAMFLPSILGSFGKILGKGISQLSASSSQASYPPANPQMEEQGYSADPMGYETNPAGTLAYPQDGMYVVDDNDLSNVDMSRFGAGGQKVSYLPTRNDYYKNQLGAASNNYKVFQKIPASSMILSNYDPFYSPLLSRLDGIFARLGLAPSENAIHDSGMQIGGQSLSDVKLEACREQLICFMYASPAKYAPYSNLISAQLSRELNELRRPVSDNPEILRFFRYMRAARRGQEGADCARAFPACVSTAAPQHAMIAAYHDINKLVTARKLK